MTAEEKMKRALVVENMKRIQKGSVSDVQFELVKEGTDKTKARNLR